MEIMTQSFKLPKQGNTLEEYEDAVFCSSWLKNPPTALFRAAVADGATEASFSKAWANLVVQAYCQGELNDEKTLIQHLPQLQKQWYAEVTQKPLPWYAVEKLQRGAFSALFGLTLYKNSYDIMAIGDSCLFHIREDKLENAFPIAHSEQFNNRPLLLSSVAAPNENIAQHIVYKQTLSLQRGDEFYLMTDALACWFLQLSEKKRQPWAEMRSLKPSHFEKWIANLRNTKALRNDDVTLLRIITQ
ncbi:MAG TPA: hypothetical protein EYP59_02705 [Thiotrichaceae bacterium]|nr:hypothetical protein [Thiotrichaceae bacterium]